MEMLFLYLKRAPACQTNKVPVADRLNRVYSFSELVVYLIWQGCLEIDSF